VIGRSDPTAPGDTLFFSKLAREPPADSDEKDPPDIKAVKLIEAVRINNLHPQRPGVRRSECVSPFLRHRAGVGPLYF
jgi:hypothetical protein